MVTDFSEYAETWTAVATDSQGVFRKLPPRASCGPNAMLWTMPSTPSMYCFTLSASPARCSALVTSSSITGASPLGSFLAMRWVSEGRGNAVSTTCAPCSCAMRAAWKAMEASVSTPVTTMRLPSRIPMLSAPFPVRRQPG